jgi:hypothetical protein
MVSQYDLYLYGDGSYRLESTSRASSAGLSLYDFQNYGANNAEVGTWESTSSGKLNLYDTDDMVEYCTYFRYDVTGEMVVQRKSGTYLKYKGQV